MKIYKRFLLVLLCFVFLIPSGCKSEKSKKGELVIGVEDINRVYDPFFITSEADLKISSQIFQTVQRKDVSNNMINYCGGISYELIGDNQVLYTVTLKDDMFFSNGKNVTVDDLIFFYHFIADASYDGYYSDWYLNDIEGLKEYYYDDAVYLTELDSIRNKIEVNYTYESITEEDFIDYLIGSEIGGKYANTEITVDSDFEKYVSSHGFDEAYSDLGENPSQDDLLSLVAEIEYSYNKKSYDPESWYSEKLVSEYIENSYSNGTEVATISGIRKVNDYSCTILFNSRNINAVSQINVPLVSREDYIVDYVKGNANEIKTKNIKPAGSGAYKYEKTKDGEVSLVLNGNYYGASPEFSSLRFVDFNKNGKSPLESIRKGEVDVISVPATKENVADLSTDDYNTVYYTNSYYTSVFFNTRTLETAHRQALASLCGFGNYFHDEYGNNYTKLNAPLSIRFAEYPSEKKDSYYDPVDFETYKSQFTEPLTEVTAYYCAGKDDFEYGLLTALKKNLEAVGISMNIVFADETELDKAVLNGKADIWLENIVDGATCDKFEYYNSQGSKNKTGLSDIEIDMLTLNLRSAVGFSDKSKMVSQLSDMIMEYAVEIPVCQLQTVTVYSYKKISKESFDFDFSYDDFTYAIPVLKKK